MLNYQTPLDLAFQALADPTRRAIVERLAEKPASVSELKRPLAMSLPAVMQHLAVLETSGLVVSQKSEQVRTCRINPAALAEAERWIAERRLEWERRLDRLGDYLQTLKAKERAMNRINDTMSKIHPAPVRVSRVFSRRAKPCSRRGARRTTSSDGSARTAIRFRKPRSRCGSAERSRCACARRRASTTGPGERLRTSRRRSD